MKHALLILMTVLALFSAPARAEILGSADKSAVVEVITQQLKAFAADDAQTAYSFAAPTVKGAFPSVDNFMAMVKQGYPPVYRNNGFDFGESFSDGLGRPVQRVVIRGADGKVYEAIYAMEKQPDGSWKIAGCQVLVVPGLNA